jgi:hypothetical protein
MYFELRKQIRFPSAVASQKASYTHKRSATDYMPPSTYTYKKFEYPPEAMSRRIGFKNITQTDAKLYLEKREQHRKTYFESRFAKK